jgi:hypothetical protein
MVMPDEVRAEVESGSSMVGGAEVVVPGGGDEGGVFAASVGGVLGFDYVGDASLWKLQVDDVRL